MNIIAYTYEGDHHCIACTENRFGQDDLGYAFTVDNEDNLVHPIFSTDEWQEYDPSFLADNPTQYLACGDCLEVIEEYEHEESNQL